MYEEETTPEFDIDAAPEYETEETIVPEVSPKVELAEHLAHLLADTVTLSHIAQGYHWNVTGPDFKEMHAFFSEIYGDLDGAVDPLAENIVKLGYDAPYFLGDFEGLSCIKGVARIEDGYAKEMIESLFELNGHLIGCAKGAFDVANAINEQGIANFLAERIDMHQKWNWQLKATLGLK
jgi:starvation-inducible DNA-binding protein